MTAALPPDVEGSLCRDRDGYLWEHNGHDWKATRGTLHAVDAEAIARAYGPLTVVHLVEGPPPEPEPEPEPWVPDDGCVVICDAIGDVHLRTADGLWVPLRTDGLAADETQPMSHMTSYMGPLRPVTADDLARVGLPVQRDALDALAAEEAQR